jgi:hypothetical protein
MKLAIVLALLAISAVACDPKGMQPPAGSDQGGRDGILERSGVTCKATADNVGKSCTNTNGDCTTLDADMKACCGATSDVAKATCSARAE